MGNIFSGGSSGGHDAIASNISSESEIMDDISASRDTEQSENGEEQFLDTISDDEKETRAKIKEEEMIQFRKQLNLKREQRRAILDRHRAEKSELEKALEDERKVKLKLYETNKRLRELLSENNIEIPDDVQGSMEHSEVIEAISHMREEFDKLKSNNNKLRCELASSNNALQNAYSSIADLSAQNTESIKQINALKEVVSVSKTMINLREQQLDALKNKLNEIEQSLADRETNMLSADLRQEYERQLQNIRTLRGLYEERARLAEVTRQALVRELEEQKLLTQAEVNKCKDLTTKVEELEFKVNSLEETISDKNNQIASCREETRGLKAEMTAVNMLFSQVLLGYKNKQDLDILIHRLEENHGLLTHMAEKENGSDSSSALPKLLLELVSQVDDNESNKNTESNIKESVGENTEIDENDNHTSNATPEEIVQNLPKVWRVLMELLSHQSEAESNTADKVTTCYKSVETKSGPVLVPSVSQTYIRLKDLIIEKLGLIKEVNRMKQLNSHLETRLGEQERRLCLVTTELSKTWHVVGRLRRHHHQLHTHEKILKYELQQKRKLLNELKEELEYCREKWEQAREKNSQSERDWKKLRTEFSNRKLKNDSTSINNSAESGYSDERPSDESSESNDESEYVAEPKIRCKKKIKKSFETILDSSADFNLAAEREDPASDMLDVADLPLDNQEDNIEPYDVSDSCTSGHLSKADKLCEETEDEVGDIANDSCVEEVSVAQSPKASHSDVVASEDNMNNDVNVTVNEETSTSQTCSSEQLSTVVSIDPAKILRNIKEQNERLALKEKKLESLEKNGASLLKKTQTIAKYSDQINNTLDHIINSPTSSHQSNLELNESIPGNTLSCNSNENYIPSEECIIATSQTNESDNNVSLTQHIAYKTRTTCENNNPIENLIKPETDFKVILDRVRQQDERLKKRDERLDILEQGCSTVLENVSNTLSSGDELINKLDILHLKHRKQTKEDENVNEDDHVNENDSRDSRDGSEPSTSSEMDHEARFAARDLRLKMLEEQTKSLVNKVNKTTTKGVKIHYKLEELHNIYGSENSRSSTPSEDTEETSQNNEQNTENE